MLPADTVEATTSHRSWSCLRGPGQSLPTPRRRCQRIYLSKKKKASQPLIARYTRSFLSPPNMLKVKTFLLRIALVKVKVQIMSGVRVDQNFIYTARTSNHSASVGFSVSSESDRTEDAGIPRWTCVYRTDHQNDTIHRLR